MQCGYGVIGSHVRLRIWCREAWGFESLYPHKCLRRATFQVVRLFFVLGKCKHSPSNKKMLGLRPLASICAIRSVVYGVAGIEIYLIFKGIPASPALRLAVESLYPHFKKSCSQDSSFFCAVSATILTFPPNLPLRKGGYKLGEQLSNHSSFSCACSYKDPYSQFWRLYILFPKFMLPLWWNQNWPLVEGCFEP